MLPQFLVATPMLSPICPTEKPGAVGTQCHAFCFELRP